MTRLTHLTLRAALLPVTLPLAVLDAVQPLDRQPDGWPVLIRLPL